MLEFPKTLKILGLDDQQEPLQLHIFCNECAIEIKVKDGYYACTKADIDCNYNVCVDCFIKETERDSTEKFCCD